jgi:hypothetical protein
MNIKYITLQGSQETCRCPVLSIFKFQAAFIEVTTKKVVVYDRYWCGTLLN